MQVQAVIISIQLFYLAAATLISTPPVACPDDTVTFTCSLPSDVDGAILWTVTPPPGLNTVSVNGVVNNIGRTLTLGTDEMFMFRAAYSGLDGGMVTSTLTTLSMVTVLAGAMVQCEDLGGAGGGLIPIRVADIPSPPLNPVLFFNQNQPSSSIITLDWDSPSSTSGVSISYVLTISPTPLSGSPVTVETTSTEITVSYNTPYNVTIRAVNCAGMSNASILAILSIVTCSSSPSTASGVVNDQIPSVPTVGSKLNFGCSGENQMRTSTCGSDGRWNPDPEDFMCPIVEPPVTCPVPGVPSMGSVSTVGQSYTEGSQVTYQCNEGLFPMGVLTSTCARNGQNVVWEPDPSTVVCRTVPVNCTLPTEPSNGAIVDYERLNETVLEGTVLTYQCDNGLSLTGPNNITCTNAGVWSTEPKAIMCVSPTEGPTATSLSIGAVVAISVIITFFVAAILGFLTGLLVMHLSSRKKAVYSLAPEGQANVGPTPPAGPVYEEVSPKEEMELYTNQAYGPVGL
ncbi:uncharacterized protein LOC135331039 [Halichondria panicea]|uniref:uncharacterized protein LOC135331039 n=1 Tax=Halichondria panicea TaxID=6063 RepID=UPI00312B8674